MAQALMVSWAVRSRVSLLFTMVLLWAFTSASELEMCHVQQHNSMTINLKEIKSSNCTKYKSLSQQDCIRQCCSKGISCNIAVYNPRTFSYQNCWLLHCEKVNDCPLRSFAGVTTFNVLYDLTKPDEMKMTPKPTSTIRLANTGRPFTPIKATSALKTATTTPKLIPNTTVTSTLAKAAPTAEASILKPTTITKILRAATKPVTFSRMITARKVITTIKKIPTAIKAPIATTKETITPTPTTATLTTYTTITKPSTISRTTNTATRNLIAAIKTTLSAINQTNIIKAMNITTEKPMCTTTTNATIRKPSTSTASIKPTKSTTLSTAGGFNKTATTAIRKPTAAIVAATTTKKTAILTKATPATIIKTNIFITIPPTTTRKPTTNIKITTTATAKPTAVITSTTRTPTITIKTIPTTTRKPITTTKKTKTPLKHSTVKHMAVFPTTSGINQTENIKPTTQSMVATMNPRTTSNLKKPNVASVTVASPPDGHRGTLVVLFLVGVVLLALSVTYLGKKATESYHPKGYTKLELNELYYRV